MSIVASFLTSLIITAYAIPSIVNVARSKKLFDYPDFRKVHTETIPTLGGMAIFAGVIFSVTFWSNQSEILELQYIIASLIILFFMGIKDDIDKLPPLKKLICQLMSAGIIVHFADVRLTTLYGLFGISDIPMWFSYLLSIFTIIVITNSFNLIDGINGLAGSVGVITTTAFGVWFYLFDSTQHAILAFSLTGGLMGFLWYNRTPARIFMGDTGSLLVGFISALLAITFIELNRVLPLGADHKVLSVPVVTISILIIPLYDTLRAFLTRMHAGKSPLAADRNHVHYRLIDLGFTHMQTTGILSFVNIFFIVFCYLAQSVRGEYLLLLVLILALGLDLVLTAYGKKLGVLQKAEEIKNPKA